MHPALTKLPTVLKVASPLVEKRAATYAADYLNKRRETRLAQTKALDEALTFDPAILKALCDQQTEPAAVAKPSSGMMALVGLVGVGVGVVLGLFLRRR